MTTIAFDTHKFIKDLTSSGMPDAQAEVLANHYVTLLTDRLATKDDIAQLAEFNQAEFASVRSEIANLENRMDTKLDVLEERLTYRINVTVLSAQLVSVIATCTIIAFLLNLQ